MIRSVSFLSILLAATSGLTARSIPGDSRRGADVFRAQHCVTCHSIEGKGGKQAPDLSRWGGRAFTPALLATFIWNHAPAMWSAMDQAKIDKPVLDDRQAADLFAYFYAFRYFEQPGEAGRGKKVFADGKCGNCHALRSGQPGKHQAPAVTQWENVTDPVAFASAMWNHSGRMYAEMKRAKMDWPNLSAQQLTDLLVYVRHLPGSSRAEPQFAATDVREGEAVYRSHGCGSCHTGKLSLDGNARSRTLADFALAMWNHAPKMKSEPQPILPDQMRSLVAYLWSTRYFDEPGNAGRGARVYAEKKCDNCHAQATWMAPSLVKRAQPLDPIDVVAAVWRHGPAMQSRMKEMKLEWPRFEGEQMSDLLAYLNSKR